MQCDALEKTVMVKSLINHRGYNEDPKGELQAFQERTRWVENKAAVTISLSCTSTIVCPRCSTLEQDGLGRGGDEVLSPSLP